MWEREEERDSVVKSGIWKRWARDEQEMQEKLEGDSDAREEESVRGTQ